MTATGTNLLGLVKHLAGVEAEYFGTCAGRPFPRSMPFWGDDVEPNADMWATPDESPEGVVALYREVHAWSDGTIDLLALDAPVHVPWWDPPDTTLQRLLIHMAVETARHAGHMDVVREAIDGQRGLLPVVPNMPDVRDDWWEGYVSRLRVIAEAAGVPRT